MQTGYGERKDVEEEIFPIEYKVLVRVDVEDDKSAGGIYLPDQARDKQQFAADRGEIVRMAGMAFADDFVFAEKPKVGDRVMFDKYAGSLLNRFENDENGRRTKVLYRLLNDKDICAILREASDD